MLSKTNGLALRNVLKKWANLLIIKMKFFFLFVDT